MRNEWENPEMGYKKKACFLMKSRQNRANHAGKIYSDMCERISRGQCPGSFCHSSRNLNSQVYINIMIVVST